MSRAFVNEDRDDDVPRVHFSLPHRDDPGYPAAAAFALLQSACDGHTSDGERATGFRWGEPALHDEVRRLIDKERKLPGGDRDERFLRVAKRFLRVPHHP